MGFPMSYRRMIGRNLVNYGGYDSSFRDDLTLENLKGRLRGIMGDLRRLEKDSFSEYVLGEIAKETELEPAIVAKVLRSWFECKYQTGGYPSPLNFDENGNPTG